MDVHVTNTTVFNAHASLWSHAYRFGKGEQLAQNSQEF